jgi:hypothetical protein
VQCHADTTLYLGHPRDWCARSAGAKSRAKRAGVDYGAPGRFIGDGYGLDQRQRRRAQPVNRNGVARLYGVGDLGGEMRRRFDFGAVAEDQSVDITAWGQRELLDLTALRGKLLRIKQRRLTPGGRRRVLGESGSADGQNCARAE